MKFRKKQVPKFLDHVFGFFPIFHFLFSITLMAINQITLSILFLYLAPPIIFRILLIIYQTPKSLTYIGKKSTSGNLWYLSYQLQKNFEVFKFLEGILKLVPELYSHWLRLWGSKIGKKINWTSGCEVVDRPFLEIGDRCLIGNQTYISAHAIKKSNEKYLLYLKKPIIGNDVVTGFRSTIGPGAIIGNRCFLDSGAAIYPNQILKEGEKYERFEELSQSSYDFLFQRN